jgi:hypothetical protein
MLHIGSHRISFGRTFWMQTAKTTVVRRFLFLWIFTEVNVQKVDLKPHFSLGAEAVGEGRRYHYCKAVTPPDYEAARQSASDVAYPVDTINTDKIKGGK